jgi:hypothetical protein
MTGTQSETFCEDVTGGSIGSTLLFQVLNLSKALIEQRRPWVLLRNTRHVKDGHHCKHLADSDNGIRRPLQPFSQSAHARNAAITWGLQVMDLCSRAAQPGLFNGGAALLEGLLVTFEGANPPASKEAI